jgi:hypothetical protein
MAVTFSGPLNRPRNASTAQALNRISPQSLSSPKMKSIALTLLSSLAFALAADAATHAVLPGKSIQAKINLAVAGDIVAIFGGTYNEDLTIDKAIRLVEVSGQQVTINGNIAFSGIVDCPPLDGFAVGSSGRGITLTNTTGMVLSNLDMPSGSYVNASASPIRIINCRLHDVTSGGGVDFKMTESQLSGSVNISGAKQVISNVTIAGGLTQGGGVLEVSKSTVAGGINQQGGTLNTTNVTVGGNFDTQTAALKTVAFRTTVAGDCNWRSKKNWFGYSNGRSFQFDGDQSFITLVGCILNPQDNSYGTPNGLGAVLRLVGNQNTILITNNKIVNVKYYHWAGCCAFWNTAVGIGGNNTKALISNNYIQMALIGYNHPHYNFNYGIFSTSNLIEIRNNIFDGCRVAVIAPFGATLNYNLHHRPTTSTLFEGGVIANNEMQADALFVENQAPKLQPTSPCVNGGTPDPRYNDRDGSRNDVGPSGGAWFDPDGWTTENPVVISFDLSPDQVLEGVDTEVILSEGQAVSAP